MKYQAANPYLPPDVYLPDTEAHVFGGRVYIYGSHDQENGAVYCMLDYVCWSAPVDDLSDWRCEGVIYKRKQDPHYTPDAYLWAPDVCRGTDGRYYLYYILSTEFEIAVAVADGPAGPFAYLGRVRNPDGSVLRDNVPFDPAVLNDGGRIWLYYGFAPTFPIPRAAGLEMPGASVVELESDMLTVKRAPKVIVPSQKYAGGTEYEGHAFFEASSVRKTEGRYYLTYSSENAHELCYAVSDAPDGEYHYRGVLVSNADLGYRGNTLPKNCYANNHGGLEKIGGQWYVFYHRHTHGHQCSRQGCAEIVEMDAGGNIAQARMTSRGLNAAPLRHGVRYSAARACCLYPPEGGRALQYGKHLENVPQITNEGEERFITGLRDGCKAVFREFDGGVSGELSVRLRGGGGMLAATVEDGPTLAEIPVEGSVVFRDYRAPVRLPDGPVSLSFVWHGEAEAEMESFLISVE